MSKPIFRSPIAAALLAVGMTISIPSWSESAIELPAGAMQAIISAKQKVAETAPVNDSFRQYRALQESQLSNTADRARLMNYQDQKALLKSTIDAAKAMQQHNGELRLALQRALLGAGEAALPLLTEREANHFSETATTLADQTVKAQSEREFSAKSEIARLSNLISRASKATRVAGGNLPGEYLTRTELEHDIQLASLNQIKGRMLEKLAGVLVTDLKRQIRQELAGKIPSVQPFDIDALEGSVIALEQQNQPKPDNTFRTAYGNPREERR